MKLHYVKIDKDWDDLAKGNSVTFILPEKNVCYSIYKYTKGSCILTGIGCYNNEIFRILDIEGCDFVRNIVGYNCDGSFPEVQSLNDLKKVIKALDDECVKKFGIPYKDYVHPSELKDGDFIKIGNSACSYIYIFRNYYNHNIYRYVSFDLDDECLNTDPSIKWGSFDNSDKITYATEEDKNLLLTALAKEGYVWDNTTKQLQKVDSTILSSDIGVIDISKQSYLCYSDTIVDRAVTHHNEKSIYPAADITSSKEKSKEELNLFPTKKHYQLNFNY